MDTEAAVAELNQALGALLMRWEAVIGPIAKGSNLPKPTKADRAEADALEHEKEKNLSDWLDSVRLQQIKRFGGPLAGVPMTGQDEGTTDMDAAIETCTVLGTTATTSHLDHSSKVERLLTDACVPLGSLAYMGRVGSVMYGLQVPSSDTDYSAVYCANPLALLKLNASDCRFEHKVRHKCACACVCALTC